MVYCPEEKIKTGRKIFREVMQSNHLGTIVNLWSWGKDGAGFMGVWLVGQRTLWDVSTPLGVISDKPRHAKKLYYSLAQWSPWGEFFRLDIRNQLDILSILTRKNAERGKLVRFLRMRRDELCLAAKMQSNALNAKAPQFEDS